MKTQPKKQHKQPKEQKQKDSAKKKKSPAPRQQEEQKEPITEKVNKKVPKRDNLGPSGQPWDL